MKYVKDETEEYVSTERHDLDGDEIIIYNANGYGSCDVTIGSHIMSWSDFDELKRAMAEAERLWRYNKQS